MFRTCWACIVFLLLLWPSGVSAGGPVTAALGGTETALEASGIAFNPAAAARVATATLEIGAAYPFGQGEAGYLALYEPKDPSGNGAAVAGMLSVSQMRMPAGGSDGVHISNVVNYQVGEEAPLFGTFGVGFRYMRDQMSLSGKSAQAWRLDVGWQGRVGNWLTLGVVGRDVLGSDLKWSDNTVVKRVGTLHAGVALHLGSVLTIAADSRNLNWQPFGETWSAGVTMRPVPSLTLRGGYQKAQGVGVATVGAGLALGNFRMNAAATIEAEPAGSLSIAIEW